MARRRIPMNVLDDPTAPTARRRKARRGAAAREALPARPSGGRPPGPGRGDGAPVRVTTYLRPDQYATLREAIDERLRAAGWPSTFIPARDRPDLSALIREALDATFPPARK